MTRVLVTGIGGFTGRYVAAALRARGHDVLGLGRDRDEPEVPDLAGLFHADLADLDAVTAVLRTARADRIVHLAAISFVAHSNLEEIYRANLVGARNLLHAIRDCGTLPDRVLMVSSANVYGNARSGALDEDTPPLPANDYAVSKLAMEHVSRIYGDWLPIIMARPFNYTGRGQSKSFLIPKLVDHAVRGETAIELGNIDVARDFSDVRGVADCYARLLETSGAVGGTFNVCSGHPRTVREVIATIEAITGLSFTVSVNPAFVRSTEVHTLWGSRARLEHTIGPLAMPPFEDTLRWMIGT